MGTLFSLERLRDGLRRLGAPDLALELWFSQSLRDYFACSHAGGYLPLRDVLAAALPRVLGGLGVEPGREERAELLGELTLLGPAPGAPEACRLLRDHDHRLVALTNWNAELVSGLLERAGLREDFSAVRSCDEIQVSKPAPAAYALAREVAVGELWMVAAHAWDVAGAARAGLRTAWVASAEGEYLSAYPAPDVVAADLPEAARAVVAASAG
jgi:2-haloacid dehalogenase